MIKLSQIKKAQAEWIGRHYAKNTDTVDYILLSLIVIIFIVGIYNVMLFMSQMAFEENHPVIIGSIIILGSIVGVSLFQLKKQ